MGLLAVLNLPPVAAESRAIRRAQRKASRRRGDHREVLEAALDVAKSAVPLDPEELDHYVSDERTETPVSKVASRSAYREIPAESAERQGRHGKVRTELDVEFAELSADDGSRSLEPVVNVAVRDRAIVPDAIGKGDTLYARKAGGLREAAGFKVPEALVLDHEHLHVLMSAQLAKLLEQFTLAAFGQSAPSDHDKEALERLLEAVAKHAEKRADEWLHEQTIPKRRTDIEAVAATARRLVGSPEVEKAARTALLDAVRRHSRALAKLRR